MADRGPSWYYSRRRCWGPASIASRTAASGGRGDSKSVRIQVAPAASHGSAGRRGESPPRARRGRRFRRADREPHRRALRARPVPVVRSGTGRPSAPRVARAADAASVPLPTPGCAAAAGGRLKLTGPERVQPLDTAIEQPGSCAGVNDLPEGLELVVAITAQPDPSYGRWATATHICAKQLRQTGRVRAVKERAPRCARCACAQARNSLVAKIVPLAANRAARQETLRVD
jgi:hypothetical protein